MAFPPFDHAALLAKAWEGGPPRHDLGGSGLVVPPWHGRGLFALDPAWLDPGSLRPDDALPARLALHAGHDGVLVTNGTSGANLAVIGALLRPGDRVVCERPTYMPLPRLAAAAGADVAWVDREPGTWRLDPAAVATAIDARTRLVLLTSPNNPTGAVSSAADLRRIGDAAAAVGAHVLVDQVFRELTDHPLAAREHGACITTAGLNKCWGAPGLRIGWALAAPDVLPAVANAFQTQLLAPSPPGTRVARRLLDHGAACRAALEQRVAATHERYRAWCQEAGVRHDPVPGALTAFPPLAIGHEGAHRLLRQGVLVLPGDSFGAPGHVRIGLGGPPAALEAALEALQRAW